MRDEILELLIKAGETLQHHIGSPYCQASDTEEEEIVRKINELPEVVAFNEACHAVHIKASAIREGLWCSICERRFVARTDFKRHMKDKHT